MNDRGTDRDRLLETVGKPEFDHVTIVALARGRPCHRPLHTHLSSDSMGCCGLRRGETE